METKEKKKGTLMENVTLTKEDVGSLPSSGSEVSPEIAALVRGMPTLESLMGQSGIVTKDLSLPEFCPPDSIPLGGNLIGRIVEVIGDFTGNPDMKDCSNLILQPITKDFKIMFPVTGELGQSMLRIPQPHPGKIICIRREEDRKNKKFKNRQFHFTTTLVTLDADKEAAMFPPLKNSSK